MNVSVFKILRWESSNMQQLMMLRCHQFEKNDHSTCHQDLRVSSESDFLHNEAIAAFKMIPSLMPYKKSHKSSFISLQQLSFSEFPTIPLSFLDKLDLHKGHEKPKTRRKNFLTRIKLFNNIIKLALGFIFLCKISKL